MIVHTKITAWDRTSVKPSFKSTNSVNHFKEISTFINYMYYFILIFSMIFWHLTSMLNIFFYVMVFIFSK